MRHHKTIDADVSRECIHISIQGIVQGVGFRPFLHRLAEQFHIQGWVRNTSSGLEGELEGRPGELREFLSALRSSPPPMAAVDHIEATPLNSRRGFRDFSIRESHTDPGSTLVSPDISICPECAKELYTPSDRRYRYPFINCTNCGPRYTIIHSLPYDRERTAMKSFPMCPDCEREYHDISDRRYHAQPDCCPDCGPGAYFVGAEKGDPFEVSQKLLSEGRILAVKGTGGIHLACDARNPDAVNRLRQKKRRMERPLAVMCRSVETAREICHISPEEERILASPARPIVLLSKKDWESFKELSFSARIGILLPYTPLHMLLLDGVYGGPDMIVMTSGNVSGCPVITDNDEALHLLGTVADGFLLHNRDIVNRCDDSLVTEWKGREYFLRKSRGYAPRPLDLGKNADGIFAMGAEQKASFALGQGSRVFLSPHIGDLKNAETLSHYKNALETYCRLFRLHPSVYVCDLHPDYLSTVEAEDSAKAAGVPLLRVQHHWAHMASCMADNGLDSRCFGIIWDGTGLGTDGSIWGGEFLTGDFSGFSRDGSIRPIPLPGGDQAVREIGRIALALVNDAEKPGYPHVPLTEDKCRAAETMITGGLSPSASSIGRLFDGVCALVLGRSGVDFEGEGAMLLESLSPVETPKEQERPLEELSYPLRFYKEGHLRYFDTRPLISGILEDLDRGVFSGDIALRFMASLCCMALEQSLSLNPEKHPVVLSGGVFQNRFLLSGVTRLLEENGFSVYTHRQAAANDEGLSLGQLAIAQKKSETKGA